MLPYSRSCETVGFYAGKDIMNEAVSVLATGMQLQLPEGNQMRKSTLMIGIVAVATGSMTAQTLSRRATLVNGGNPNGGKCTIEVVVDGSAEVELRGDTANLRNTGGQAPQWRRFECTAAMPASPPNFRFAGVDGRGDQSLVRGPGNNGGAVVRIVDSEGGAQGYTFDVFWGNYGGSTTQDRFPQDRGPQGPDRRPFDRGELPGQQRFTRNQAVQVCQDSVRDRAVSRFRTPNIDFRRIAVDDNPGRQDWVTGELAIRRRFGRPDVYGFSCSVDFRTGQVRTAQIDQFERSYYPQGR
jgi:hypothetical protein